MPTYEYQCDACDHNFDEFQSMSDKPLKKCPKCGKSKLRRLFGGGSAVIFKGSGFYQTDYRSESYKQAQQKDQNSASSSTDKPSDKPADKSSTSSSNGTSGEAKSGGGDKSSGKKAK